MAVRIFDEYKIKMALHKPEICESKSIGNFSACREKITQQFQTFVDKMWKLAKDDPRRVLHAIKVGLALSVVSLFYLMEPLFDGVGDNAIWAIMTVVVVFEFTAGATSSKGLNRGIGTVIAGSLAVSIGYIAEKAGKIGEAVVIGSCCFTLGTAATFVRFFPKIKMKYDYGVVIFLLTFNMITVSGYRVENIFRMAYERLSTIAIGCVVSLVISLCICPIWAGEDLHHSAVKRIHGLAESLEGCMVEYFKGSQFGGMNEDESDKIVEGYRDVLDCKASEESLANFASWEPGHGKFGFRHPWKQYVKVGGMLRQMAYCVVALHGCLRSEYQAPHIDRLPLKKPCSYKVGMEVAKVLHELAEDIKSMRQCPPTQSMIESLHVAVEELKNSFSLQPIHKREQNGSNRFEAKNIHANPAQQSSQTQRGPQEHHKSIQIFSENDNVGISTEVNGMHYCSPESLYVDKIEKYPAANNVFSEAVVPTAAFASLVIEMVARLEDVIEAVQELGKLAGFKP